MGGHHGPMAFERRSSFCGDRCRGCDSVGTGRQSTGSNEPFREVLAAWIVALLLLVAGCSVLVFHARDVREDGLTAVIPRWYPPPVAGTEDLDEIPDRAE